MNKSTFHWLINHNIKIIFILLTTLFIQRKGLPGNHSGKPFHRMISVIIGIKINFLVQDFMHHILIIAFGADEWIWLN